jgi:uncharacterized protein YkwD
LEDPARLAERLFPILALNLVNRDRKTAGFAPLAADPELTEVARQHSIDMFRRGYFAHVTPENESPFDRIREAKIHFSTAGENLALAGTGSFSMLYGQTDLEP